MQIALVNTNRIKPPIAPVGLEYVAEVLDASGHQVQVLDLCWEGEWDSAIDDFLSGTNFDLIGVTLRNTDDCAYTSRQSFLGEFADMVGAVRPHTDALIALGGVGFSVMPEQVMELCEADVGLWGDGDFGLLQLADRIERRQDWHDLPNLIWRDHDGWHRNPPSTESPADLPPISRRWVDNQRYFREGGQAGVETKRGCSGRCIYCADPVAKGTKIRIRPPKAVADELERLLEQGIDHIHTCDSEFNLPQGHAIAVCKEMIRRNLGDKLRWYAYCAPVPFSPELAKLMHRAGCVGINFGVDNGDERMLGRLRRGFMPNHIVNATRLCKEAGMVVMLDLLLGSPGETQESVIATIDLMRQVAPHRVGVALGVRIYPGTELAHLVTHEALKEGLVGGSDVSEPLFFLEPVIANMAFELLDRLIGDDERFFFFDPSRPDRNYNYNANERLIDAILEGHRGAYWDILRKYNPDCA
ncbi:MAG: radical SAM protein [Desulfobacterales bacterium]|nr:MAG: radical SAM protein [Desulfobacterales bacterium]